MKTQHGLMSTGILIAIVLGLVVVSGGVYYIVNQQSLSLSTTSSNTALTSNSSFPWATISQVPDADKYYSIASNVIDYYPNGDAKTEGGNKNIMNISADAATFVVGNGPNVSWTRFAKDKNTIYYSGEPIIGADLQTFTPLPDLYDKTQISPFAKDLQHVYLTRFARAGESAGQVIPNADPATFTALGWVFAKDKNTVWSARAGEGLSGLYALPDADASTFIALLFQNDVVGYFKDKNHVYWLESVIPGADPATFVVDEQVPGDPCPGSVCPIEYRAHDKTRIYQGSEVISTNQSNQNTNTITISAPTTGSVLVASQKTTLRWSVPPTVVSSFPSDFNLHLFARAEKQGDTTGAQGAPINDGNDFLFGSAQWNIPGYIAHGQLTTGMYKIVWYLQATPKDQARMCAETVGKDCSPSATDRAVMERSLEYRGETGWFEIK